MFSPDGTLISASTAPHYGEQEADVIFDHDEVYSNRSIGEACMVSMHVTLKEALQGKQGEREIPLIMR